MTHQERPSPPPKADTPGAFATSLDAEGAEALANGDITLDSLTKLKEVFDEAAAKSDDQQLTEPEFLAAFGPIFGRAMTEAELRIWFMRIDASANGSVDWDEFASFLLYSRSGERTVVTSSGVPLHEVSFVRDPAQQRISLDGSATRTSGAAHAGPITKILVHSRLNKVLTASQDGTIRTWDAATLAFSSVLHVGRAWVTDMAFVKHERQLIGANLDRQIFVYEVSTEKLIHAFVGNSQLHEAPVLLWPRALHRIDVEARAAQRRRNNLATATGAASAMNDPLNCEESDDDYRQRREHRRALQRAMDAGDNMVKLYVLVATDNPVTSLHVRVLPNGHEVVFLGCSDGKVQSYNSLLAPQQAQLPDLIYPDFDLDVHSTFVTTLQWVQSLGLLVSTGNDGRVFLINVEKKQATVLPRGQDHGPLHSAAWMESERLLATCGAARHVALTAPQGKAPPVLLQGGHLNNVTHVHAMANDHLLLSLDIDKTIKLWDVRSMRCLQTILDHDVHRPANRFGALTYDARRHRVLTGATQPISFAMQRLLVPYPNPRYCGHQHSLVAALFNPVYKQLVTVDATRCLLWDVLSGELISTTTVADLRGTSTRSDGGVDPASYGAFIGACFDHSLRRLVLATARGVVFLVNGANGQLLQEMIPEPPNDDDAAPKSGRGGTLSGRRPKEASQLPPATRRPESTSMAYFQAGAKHFVGLLVGQQVAVWEDEGGAEQRLERVASASLHRERFLHLTHVAKAGTSAELPNRWRPPTPTCVCGMPPGHLAVGTDAGCIMVLSSSSLEPLSLLARFDPTTSVAAMAFCSKRELLFAGNSDGSVCIVSQVHKGGRVLSMSLRDSRVGRGGIGVTSLAVSASRLLVGCDDGFVFAFTLAAFDFQQLEMEAWTTATLAAPHPMMPLLGGFQAHASDALCLAEFTMEDVRDERLEEIHAAAAPDTALPASPGQGFSPRTPIAPATRQLLGSSASTAPPLSAPDVAPVSLAGALEGASSAVPSAAPPQLSRRPSVVVPQSSRCSLSSLGGAAVAGGGLTPPDESSVEPPKQTPTPPPSSRASFSGRRVEQAPKDPAPADGGTPGGEEAVPDDCSEASSPPVTGSQKAPRQRSYAEQRRDVLLDTEYEFVLITGGAESQVRLFTGRGDFVGYCGDPDRWSLEKAYDRDETLNSEAMPAALGDVPDEYFTAAVQATLSKLGVVDSLMPRPPPKATPSFRVAADVEGNSAELLNLMSSPEPRVVIPEKQKVVRQSSPADARSPPRRPGSPPALEPDLSPLHDTAPSPIALLNAERSKEERARLQAKRKDESRALQLIPTAGALDGDFSSEAPDLDGGKMPRSGVDAEAALNTIRNPSRLTALLKPAALESLRHEQQSKARNFLTHDVSSSATSLPSLGKSRHTIADAMDATMSRESPPQQATQEGHDKTIGRSRPGRPRALSIHHGREETPPGSTATPQRPRPPTPTEQSGIATALKETPVKQHAPIRAHKARMVPSVPSLPERPRDSHSVPRLRLQRLYQAHTQSPRQGVSLTDDLMDPDSFASARLQELSQKVQERMPQTARVSGTTPLTSDSTWISRPSGQLQLPTIDQAVVSQVLTGKKKQHMHTELDRLAQRRTEASDGGRFKATRGI